MANLEMNKHYIVECVDRGAKFVCLPEYFAYMNHPAIPNGWNESINGPLI
jgi:predicted amidohydrolase